MLYPAKLLDIEVSAPVNSIAGLQGYASVQLFLRLHNKPIGYIKMPVTNDTLNAQLLTKLIIEKHGKTIIKMGLCDTLTQHEAGKEFYPDDLFTALPLNATEQPPLVTVAVCTRNRTTDLDQCLEAVSKLIFPNLDLLVIDNAPDNNNTELLLKQKFPTHQVHT